MKCPYCNGDTDLSKSFCINCGAPLKNNNVNNVNTSGVNTNVNNNVNPQVTPNVVTGDTMYEDAFMGPKANDFRNGKFNPFAFLFGVFYLAYRKMYLYAVLYSVIVFSIEFILPEDVSLGSLYSIILGLVINKIYLSFVKKKVEKIKNTSPSTSPQEISQECARKGGTSVGAVVVSIILYIVFMIGLVILIFFVFAVDMLNEYEDKYGSNYTFVENLYVPLPEGMVQSNTSSYSEELYSINNETDNCSILVKYDSNNFNTEQEYLDSVKFKSGLNSNYETKNINNRSWVYLDESDNTLMHHYVIKEDDGYYYVRFISSIYGNSCKELNDNIQSKMTIEEETEL